MHKRRQHDEPGPRRGSAKPRRWAKIRQHKWANIHGHSHAGEDANRLEVLESMTRHTVEQVELARDLDASEGECTEHKASRQRWHFVECQQNAADGE
jgi:hypothetical protein